MDFGRWHQTGLDSSQTSHPQPLQTTELDRTQLSMSESVDPSNGHHRYGHQTFNEPPRYLPRPDDSQPDICGLPRWLLSIWFRLRNTLSVYNFFTIYCLNALLNVEIYREYMATHDDQSVYHRSWTENLYILTLSAPLVDVLVRCLARNFFKLNLAKAQSHVSFASSLAITTPSLNTYALLVLRRNSKTIIGVMLLDLLEILYSAFMFEAQQHKSEALYFKLFFLVLTSIFWVWDVVALIQYRRFFKPLPPHVHPIFICWDVNHSFHWHSPNSIFDIMERHEDIHSATFTSSESHAVRKRIAEWNEGEEALANLDEAAVEKSPAIMSPSGMMGGSLSGRSSGGARFPHTNGSIGSGSARGQKSAAYSNSSQHATTVVDEDQVQSDGDSNDELEQQRLLGQRR